MHIDDEIEKEVENAPSDEEGDEEIVSNDPTFGLDELKKANDLPDDIKQAWTGVGLFSLKVQHHLEKYVNQLQDITLEVAWKYYDEFCDNTIVLIKEFRR